MFQRIALLTLVVTVGWTLGCSRQPSEDPAEVAFGELRTAFYDTEDETIKADLAEQYLAEYPDTSHTPSMAATVAYYRGERLEDPQRAVDVLQSALDQIQDPDNRFEVSMAMVPLAAELGQPLDLAQIADDLAAHRELTFSDHLSIMEAAEDADRWAITEQHADAALAFATETAYRADYPDLEMDDDEVAERAIRRRGWALAYKGWALFNLGQAEDGMALLDEAAGITPKDYMGVSSTPLDLFRGKTLLGQGEAERAIDVLARGALFGRAEETMPVLREAYMAANGDEQGFDEYLWSTRDRLAKQVDDFTLPDYEGSQHSLSELTGRVVLLAFWFPT